MQLKVTVLYTHWDAADLGWGGTVIMDLQIGADRAPLQGLRSPEERATTIAFWGVRALRRVLESLPSRRGAEAEILSWKDAAEGCQSTTEMPRQRVQKFLCWVDNFAIVYMLRDMVTALSELISE